MSHYSSIGFEVSSLDDIMALATRIEPSAESISVRGGEYRRWSGGSGEEMWITTNDERQVVNVAPHFSGESSVPVRVALRLQRDGASPLEGSLHCEADPGEDVNDCVYPFVFECANFAVLASAKLPHIARFQITAFAHEATYYASSEDYDAAQAKQEMKFAIQSFFPMGLFRGEGASGPPEAIAMFTGLVRAGGVRTNSLTGLPFHWALVETLGGKYDVVIDPKLLPTAPAAGGVLTVTGWLSGRLVSEPKRERGWLRRWFGPSEGSHAEA